MVSVTRNRKYACSGRFSRDADPSSDTRFVVVVFIFFSFQKIFIKTINNNEIKIDSRPSDAIAIALKTLAPIFVIEKVIESATLKSIVIENGISTPARKDSEISKFETLDNLKDALNKAIKDEEYEIAAKLRDKITNIEGNS